jgi:hypothetical protein
MGRHRHVALWTGTHMLVWGGEQSEQSFQPEGARYGPADDSWASLAYSGGFLDATAVWTGSELITWGGVLNDRHDNLYRWEVASYALSGDLDGDGICNASDVCPLDSDPAQLDADGDGTGDACDPCPFDPRNDDADGDLVCDVLDNCLGTSNPSQTNSDSDELGDACDNCALVDNIDQTDSDLDVVVAPTSWAVSAIASSEFSPTEYSAMQATGAPDSLACSDDERSWSPATGGADPEWIELTYDPVLRPTGVVVHETNTSPPFAPGATGFVTQIDLIDTDGAYHSVFSGPDTTLCGGQLVVSWPATAYDVAGVRVSTAVPGYEEIDAVGLSTNVVTPHPDGVGDVCDNCPGVHNPDQADSDQDGTGDACE